MTAGLIQLVTNGTQDIFLTGSPQITFFKMVYRRYTNFAIESVEQGFDGVVDFDKFVTSTLDKNGDLINRAYLEVIIPEVQLLKKDLNPDYAPPTSNIISGSGNDNNFGKAFRPDDIPFALKTSAKRSAEVAFFTYKILIEYLVDIYRFSIQQIDNGVDLDVKKDINNIFPEGSFAYDLFDINDGLFNEIPVDESITKLLVNYYKDFFILTENEIRVLNIFSKENIFSYSYIVNDIIQKKFLNSNQNSGIILPEIVFSKINLKQIMVNFFENTVDELLDDQDREDLLRIILDQWYIDAKETLIFLEKEYIKATKELEDVKSPYVKFAWIKRIGHYIAEHIEVTIGGKRIDKHYSDWMNIWYELSKNIHHEDHYKKMIGDVEYLTTFDNNIKPQYKLYIPLQFWFCRHNGLALPLVSLRYHDVKINIKFRKLEQCAFVEAGYTLFEALHIDYASLFIDYIYLDSLERKRFARASHEYLIEQVQREEFKDIVSTKHSAKLNFVHPCKELIWTCQANRYKQNPTDGNLILNPSNYSYSKQGIGNPILEAKLEFNTHIRVQKLDGNYFNYVQPYQSHSNTPADGINVYSFAMESEQHQPSGTVNFSRINFIVMHLILDKRIFINKCDVIESERFDIEDEYECNCTKGYSFQCDVLLKRGDRSRVYNFCKCKDELLISSALLEELSGVVLTFYAPNYNVLRIMSGMAGIAFSS